jgi:hypothetical protein
MVTIGLRVGSQYPHPKSKFTADEDSHLLELVEQFGVSSWPQRTWLLWKPQKVSGKP